MSLEHEQHSTVNNCLAYVVLIKHTVILHDKEHNAEVFILVSLLKVVLTVKAHIIVVASVVRISKQHAVFVRVSKVLVKSVLTKDHPSVQRDRRNVMVDRYVTIKVIR